MSLGIALVRKQLPQRSGYVLIVICWDRAIYLTSTSMNQVVTTASLATICVTCKPVEKEEVIHLTSFY